MSKPRFGPNWALRHKLDSKFEGRVLADLDNRGIGYTFHPRPGWKYTIPASIHTYNTDLQLENGIYVEFKGMLDKADGDKLLLVKEQHPDKDLRLVFERLKCPYNGNKTRTVEQWAIDHGFKYAEKTIPQSWVEEKRK